jgi:hypothetical protein
MKTTANFKRNHCFCPCLGAQSHGLIYCFYFRSEQQQDENFAASSSANYNQAAQQPSQKTASPSPSMAPAPAGFDSFDDDIPF